MKIECSICFEKIDEDGSQVSLTKCGHLFHYDCVKTWMKHPNGGSCPQCRNCLLTTDLRMVFFNTSDRNDFDNDSSSPVPNIRTVQKKCNAQIKKSKLKIKRLEAELKTLKDQLEKSKKNERKWKNEAENVTLVNTKLENQLKAAKKGEKKWILEAKKSENRLMMEARKSFELSPFGKT